LGELTYSFSDGLNPLAARNYGQDPRSSTHAQTPKQAVYYPPKTAICIREAGEPAGEKGAQETGAVAGAPCRVYFSVENALVSTLLFEFHFEIM
jgi:hypothetical protein